MTDLKPYIAKVAQGESLLIDEAKSAFEIIMSGQATPAQIGGLLMGLRVKGEKVSEISGAAAVMRSKALVVSAPAGAIDMCGTGGDGSHTLNISTASTFVVAACGVPIAKHGNRASSSKSGAADVLTALGINIDLEPEQVRRCIDETGLGFMMATRHHSAMKHVGPVRVELGTRTIFNLLGPLANPAKTKRQLLGVFAEEWVEPIARVLSHLGLDKAMVVHGQGLDEITTTGITTAAMMTGGRVKNFEIDPSEFDIPLVELDALKGGDAEFNAAALERLVDGEISAYRDIVLLNSAAGLLVADKVPSMAAGVSAAREAIDNGGAKQVLDNLRRVSNSF